MGRSRDKWTGLIFYSTFVGNIFNFNNAVQIKLGLHPNGNLRQDAVCLEMLLYGNVYYKLLRHLQ